MEKRILGLLFFILCLSLVGGLLGASSHQPVSSLGRPHVDPGSRKSLPTALRYLALGDSYTIGQSIGPRGRYPVQAMEILAHSGWQVRSPEIIAATGWTTENLWTAIKDKPLSPAYDVVSLLIGVNNQYQGLSLSQYRLQFCRLLEKSLALAGGRPGRVWVLSIPDYGLTPFGGSGAKGQISRQIDSFNALNRQLAAACQVHYLDITAESRKVAADPGLLAADGLHYSAAEYTLWARLLATGIQSEIK